jgi:hypothetical protein
MIVEEWFENKLLKVVATGTVFVLDNAPFHRKKILEAKAVKDEYTCPIS